MKAQLSLVLWADMYIMSACARRSREWPGPASWLDDLNDSNIWLALYTVNTRRVPFFSRVPSTRDLHEAFLRLTSWQEYRESVVSTLHKETLGEPIALLPATDKGSSGWARWPGLNVKRKPAFCFLHDDRLSCVCNKSLLKKGYESNWDKSWCQKKHAMKCY